MGHSSKEGKLYLELENHLCPRELMIKLGRSLTLYIEALLLV